MTEIARIWHRVPEWKGWIEVNREPAARTGPRVGRRRSTTQDHITDVALELFTDRGFDDVSVDDVARAAGIARRTLFRYYPSKNAIPWGDFDAHLDLLRDLLLQVPADAPTSSALRSTLLAFNSFDEAETAITVSGCASSSRRRRCRPTR